MPIISNFPSGNGSGGSNGSWNLNGLIDLGETDDVESGTFENTGSGWNTYTFKTPFCQPPIVFLQADGDGNLACIKEVTAEKFIYIIKPNTASTVNVNYLAIGGSND